MEYTHQPDFSNISNIFIALAEAVEKELVRETKSTQEDEKSEFD